MATTIDLPEVKQLSWQTTTKYGASDILTYNIALGASGIDLSRSFEGHPKFHALPTFSSVPVIAIMGDVTRSMSTFLPNFKPWNLVHGEHYIESYRTFPTKETTLQTTARIVDVADRRSGVTVCVGITTADAATGEKICYNEWTSFILKVPGKGASKKIIPRGAATASYPAPDDVPDAVIEEKTTPEQGALYRAVSGDLNPLHIDPAVAKAGGFEGPILTGTCTIGMGVKHVIDKFGDGDSLRFKSVKLRLSKPVYPGEVIKTEMWCEEGGSRIVYKQLAGDKGKVVISNAAVELKGRGELRL
jgi:acyl dehydratase